MTDFDDETILFERPSRVGWITQNRPKARNALNLQLMHEVLDAATALDRDPEIGCLVITGSAKAFVAGAASSRWRRGTTWTCT